MKIIAIDPGFAATGVAVMDKVDGQWRVVDRQCVRTKPPTQKRGLRVADQDAARVAEMVRGLNEIFERHRPGGAAVELPHGGGKSAKAIRCMGLATGMIVALVERWNIPVEWYGPHETRKAATGSVAASKDDVMAAMKRIFPELETVPTKAELEHIADACSTFQAARTGNLVRMS